MSRHTFRDKDFRPASEVLIFQCNVLREAGRSIMDKRELGDE